MKKIKIMTLVGTRPELIKLSRVIAKLDEYTNHILVHSGQNYDYELNEVFFNDLEIRKPDYFLESAGSTSCETISKVIANTEKIIIDEKPDAMLVYGDTNSCLGGLAAKRHRVPLFHMEAGNRCFDERVPEEINRRIIDHISDINMPLTEHGRRYLLEEGINPETIFKTGSCMQEVLEYYNDGINSSKIVDNLELKDKDYFVISLHREENVDNQTKLQQFATTITSLSKHYNKKIVFSVHPRTNKRLSELNLEIDDKNIKLLKPLGFYDYIRLQKSAFCVISDSGTVFEESSLLNFPAITIRDAHERPEGIDSGVLIMSGPDINKVIEAVDVITRENKYSKLVNDYQGGAVSIKVLNIILSYTDYIKRTVWQE